MTFYDKLNRIWRKNNSMVCVGLDPDLKLLPDCLKLTEFPLFAFNKRIIDATHDLVCAYKPQAAYYAGQDADDQLKMTLDYLRTHHPEIPLILDAKRGDIGSTARMYAFEAFERYQADAVTLNPYLGTDSLKPFLDYTDRGAVILCRTSNPSSGEVQELGCDGETLFERIAVLARDRWNYNRNVLLVIGATFPQELGKIRRLCPDIPFLVPGIGAQGGDVRKVLENGLTADGFGLVINSSRAIIYADNTENFAAAAREAAAQLRRTINENK
ncbi:MAG: orotidine-5'-phosphate decarboxylase [Victivallaceae bacterium]|nr:orotidine-5'-phosphate decarboxylase [Victivallaceae bacterium]